MIAIVWQFEIRSGREKEFEDFYGAEGDWTAASRLSRSYLGSSFLRDQNRDSRYLVIEYWSEMLVSEQHKPYRQDRDPAARGAARRAGVVDRTDGHLHGARRPRSRRAHVVTAVISTAMRAYAGSSAIEHET